MNEHLPAFQSRSEPCHKDILFEARFSAIDPPARFDQGTTCRQ